MGRGAGICLVLASGVIPALILGVGAIEAASTGSSCWFETVDPLISDVVVLGRLDIRVEEDEGVAFVFPDPPKKLPSLPLAGVMT